ncbi:ribosome small subunit-dependent GTPase A [Leisingera sp. M658]|uniref:ribosome small subunit-dependent GTPase A n=1 Tax=Leisingera sp. M658 TaxID=2867015 RepID=UPI0021A7B314|nr:ribosome small subunit-dependent GTPase A [Leisingera sp. M658]UWQ73382.1 ribosome small subunit-dependent GTPase A [Leisingera sp. M658]
MNRRKLPGFLNTPVRSQVSSGLSELGFKPFFQHQMADAADGAAPARITAIHRSQFDLISADGPLTCPAIDGAAVGDWLLLDPETGHGTVLLERASLFRRRAPGTGRETQLIAANIDTLFIVTSCNHDFNIARLERFLALANEANTTPVIILTKADLADDPDSYRTQAQSLQPGLVAETIDATNPAEVNRLRAWCGLGETVALAGSSGVGKSTLANTLAGGGLMQTGAIREDDSKGRHTTSHRQMLRLPGAGWLIDTPGMRELQISDAQDGIDMVFQDLTDIAAHCRFRDCQHESEPGCAIQAAAKAGQLDTDRIARWQKLRSEDAFNAQSPSERRAAGKALGKVIKQAKRIKRKK